MNRISLYVFRHLAVATVIVTVVLTFAIWMTQSLRLLEVIIDGAAPFGLFVKLVGLSLPNFLVVVMPLAVVAAAIFVYNRLLIDSELVVMRAAGLGPLALAAPAFAVAALVALAGYALNFFFLPLANLEFRAMKGLADTEYSTAFLREGQFNSAGGDITVYFRERSRSGELLGILVHDGRVTEKPVTVIADRGLLLTTDTGPRVVMFGGSRQEADRETGQVSFLFFDQYAIDLEVLTPDLSQRQRDPRERFVGELLNPDMSNSYEASIAPRLITEGHDRLAGPLLAFGLVFLALGMLWSGEFNRRSQTRRLVAAIVSVVALQSMALGVSGLARETIVPYGMIYAVPALGVAVGLYLMHRRPRQSAMPAALPTAA
ncbi:MAG: LPS export ABC transporter permease LptF [Inquilinaceae bacterium]